MYEGGKAALANFGMAWFIEHTDLSFTVNRNSDNTSPYTACLSLIHIYLSEDSRDGRLNDSFAGQISGAVRLK